MNAGLNLIIEIIVFALVVALAMAGMRMAEAMLDVRRRLGTGADVATGPSGILRTQGATPVPS